MHMSYYKYQVQITFKFFWLQNVLKPLSQCSFMDGGELELSRYRVCVAHESSYKVAVGRGKNKHCLFPI